ncbi:hypothetical protein FB639_005320, partial [Coemansia asiatica]
MDKDKFRELLQAFEQLSVKPEAGADGEVEAEVAATPGTPILISRKFSSMQIADSLPHQQHQNQQQQHHHKQQATLDIDRFLDIVRENGTSFPELEATHPPPHCEEFKPSAILKSIAAEEYNGVAGMRIQQQLHTASRFRFTAGLAARLYFQLSA